MTNNTNSAHNIFNFEGHDLRTIESEGRFGYALADVCRAVGYAVKSSGDVNTTLAKGLLREDEYFTCSAREFGTRGRPMIVATEAGRYRLVMRSDKPMAKRFQNWVVKHVLPGIRQDGVYVDGQEKLNPAT